MIEHFRSGVRFAVRNPATVAALWAIHFIVGLIVALPMANAVRLLGDTGFGPDMAARADVGVLADMTESIGSGFGLVLLNLLWALPLLAVVRALAAVGIINRARNGGIRSFMDGVSRFGPRSLVLAIPFFIVTAIAQGAVFLALAMAGSAIGERGNVLLFVVALPVGLLVVGAIADCMRDYGQITLVTRGAGIWDAFARGLAWPLQHPRSLVLYGAWMVAAIAATVLPLVFELNLAAATTSGILTLALLQQMLLFVRAGVTVGWYGSETGYYEEKMADELPLIADAGPSAEESDRGLGLGFGENPA